MRQLLEANKMATGDEAEYNGVTVAMYPDLKRRVAEPGDS